MAMTSSTRRERAIERYLLDSCRKVGFLCLKFVSPVRGGVPDRIVITPTVGTVFVEVKKPGEQPDPRQRITHSKMRRFGAQIHVVDDRRSVDRLIDRLLAGGRDDESSQHKEAS